MSMTGPDTPPAMDRITLARPSLLERLVELLGSRRSCNLSKHLEKICRHVRRIAPQCGEHAVHLLATDGLLQSEQQQRSLRVEVGVGRAAVTQDGRRAPRFLSLLLQAQLEDLLSEGLLGVAHRGILGE